DLQPVLRRAVAEGEVARLGLDRRSLCAEQLLDALARAPQRRRGDARGRRHMLADGLEQLTNEARRRPVGEADLAPELTDASPAAAGGWSELNVKPNVETRSSKEASAKGNASASASWNAISSRSAAARWRPRSSRAGT